MCVVVENSSPRNQQVKVTLVILNEGRRASHTIDGLVIGNKFNGSLPCRSQTGLRCRVELVGEQEALSCIRLALERYCSRYRLKYPCGALCEGDGGKLYQRFILGGHELLRVVCPSGVCQDTVVQPRQAHRTKENSAEATEAEAEAYLEAVARSLRGKGLHVRSVTMRGTPSETIVQYAQENGIDLCAIATHRRSGIGRLVFGSVADFVLRELGIPVLVVKPQDDSL